MVTEINGNFILQIEQKHTEEPSSLFGCTKIELVNNHIMVWKKKDLVLKVWLKKENYNDLNKVLKMVGMKVHSLDYKDNKNAL